MDATGSTCGAALAALNVIQAVLLAWLASGPARARSGADRRATAGRPRRKLDRRG